MKHFLGGAIWDRQNIPLVWRKYCERPDLKKLVDLPSLSMQIFMDWEDPPFSMADLKIADGEDAVYIISGYPRVRTDLPCGSNPINFLQSQLFSTKSLETVLCQMDGEFVIVGVHKLSGAIILAVDPVGSRNLYYRRIDGGIIWGTSPLAISLDDRTLSIEGLNLYLSLKGIPAPDSILEGVRKVQPGSYIRVERTVLEERPYWHLEEKMQEICTGTYDELQIELLHTLQVSINNCLEEADGNVGAFLSGGLDSSLIVSLAKASGIYLQAYSLGYTDSSYTDETEAAGVIAGKLGIPILKYKCSPSEVMELVEQKLNDEVEPVADSAFFPELLLSRLCSSNAVILDGTGADCIFGGSNKYIAADYLKKYEKIPALLRKHLIFPLSSLLPASRSFRLTNAIRKFQYFLGSDQLPEDKREFYWYYFLTPSQLRSLLLPAWQTENTDWIDAYLKQFMPIHTAGNISTQSFTTLKTIMPAVELLKLSSIENFGALSIRKPFLSTPIIELGLCLPDEYKVKGGIRKRILRDLGKKILPEEILRYPKTNFNPPITKWIKGPLKEMLMDTLTAETGLFNVSAIKKMEIVNRMNWRDSSSQLWAMFVLIHWLTGNNVKIPGIHPVDG